MTRMSTSRGPSSFDPRAVGPATRALCVLSLVATVICGITERRMGFGTMALSYDVGGILHICSSGGWSLTRSSMRTPAASFFGLIILYLVGASFEASYGTRDFVRFFGFGAIGAGIIAIPLHFAAAATGVLNDIGIGVGSGPAIDAMFMALALTAPDSNILMGFVLPIRVRTAILLLVVAQFVYALMEGGSLSLTLGGLAMGYLLVTGVWRPSRWVGKRSRKINTSGLYIVPPRRNDTLH